MADAGQAGVVGSIISGAFNFLGQTVGGWFGLKASRRIAEMGEKIMGDKGLQFAFFGSIVIIFYIFANRRRSKRRR